MDKQKQAIRYMNEKKYEKAATLLQAVIEENPEDPTGYINLGNLLILLQDYERAEILLKRATELDGKAATAYYGLGNLFYEQALYQAAQRNFQKAIQLGLEDADVFFMLGMACKMQGYEKLAFPYLLRAKELHPQDPEMLFQYGLSLAKLEMLDEARKIFLEVLALDNQQSDAHYNLGVIEMYHDQYEKARTHFQQALKIQPNHVLAKNGIKKADNHLS